LHQLPYTIDFLKNKNKIYFFVFKKENVETLLSRALRREGCFAGSFLRKQNEKKGRGKTMRRKGEYCGKEMI
jgi:hypothetical protein